jgi:hypothetical protein
VSDHNLDLDEWEGAKHFDLGCRLCEGSFPTFETWENHFVKNKLCPKMPKDQPDVPIGHRSEEFYLEDLRQQNLAKAFAIPERSLAIKPSTYMCKFCDVFSSSQVTFNEHPWLRCDKRFQCAFTACGHVFKVILWLKPTNLITLKMQSHAVNAR